MKKILSLFVMLMATCLLWAGNTIIYTASAKLEETTNIGFGGIHTNAFDVAIINHTYSNGIGTITFADDVTNIGDRAFFASSELISISIPNSVTNIGVSAFYSCTNLSSADMSNSVTSIGNRAFQFCTNLTSITLSENIERLGDYTFYDCTNLSTINIPVNVGSIGDYCFYNCSELTTINLPENITHFGEHCFGNCSGLTTINIPHNVTAIGTTVFQGCTGVTAIIWNAKQFERIETCSSSPFYGLRNQINSFVFGDSVVVVPDYICYEMAGLASVEIPEGVMTIGDSVFYGCIGVTSIAWNAKQCVSPAYYSKSPFSAINNQISHFVFGDSVIIIPDFLCYKMSNVPSITIPDNVTTIGKQAFYDCFGLSSVTIPERLTHIGDDAFCGCSGLTSISIPDGVISIGGAAFGGCIGLTSLEIPNTVTSIGIYAFNSCTGLTSIVIPTSVTSISLGMFEGCTGLTSIVIPNSVLDIGKYAFYGCTGLSSITIPSSVTSIGEYAFMGCSNLLSLDVEACEPPTISLGIFYDVNLSKITLPNGTLRKYLYSDWVEYIEILSEKYDFSAISEDPLWGYVDVKYDCGTAILTATASEGYHFARWNDGNTENPRCVVLTQDSVFMAYMAPNQCAVTVSSEDIMKGSVEGSAIVDYLGQTVLSATPAEGYHFVQWSDGNTDNPRTIVVTQDTALVASFAINQYLLTLSVNDENMGIVTGGGLYEHKSMVEIKATPVSGYEFIKWSDGSTYNPYTFIIREDMSLQAEFREIQSGLEDIATSSNVQKIFRDGHFYILRDGQLYDATGRRVE